VLPVYQQGSYINFLNISVLLEKFLMSVLFPPFRKKQQFLHIFSKQEMEEQLFLFLFSQRKFDVSAARFPGTEGGRRGDSKNCKMIPNTGGFPEPRKTCE
jgi:hypothetical protein